MHGHTHQTTPQTRGITIPWARLYDKLSFWQILTLGQGVKLWEEMLNLTGLQPGQMVLDIGCGQGSLTLKAKARVGQAGQAFGIDASPEMIAVAREKAERTGVQVDFRLEAVEKMSFPDQSFDAVLSSLMMHHLPDDLKRQALAEVHRVLKPGGVLVIFDFNRPETRRSRLSLPGLLHRTIPTGLHDLGAYMEDANFDRVELCQAQIKLFGYMRGYVRPW